MYYLNGNYYESDPMGSDFFYGLSLFETIMGKKNNAVFLDEHLKRRWIQINKRMKEIGPESYYQETKDLPRY